MRSSFKTTAAIENRQSAEINDWSFCNASSASHVDQRKSQRVDRKHECGFSKSRNSQCRGQYQKACNATKEERRKLKIREIERWEKSATPVPILLITANTDTQNQFGEDDDADYKKRRGRRVNATPQTQDENVELQTLIWRPNPGLNPRLEKLRIWTRSEKKHPHGYFRTWGALRQRC
jgi:hypothetical protein